MGLTIAFWALAITAVAAALGVVLLKNIFRAALSLILCFLTVSGIYITLSADFLAAVQILIYVGAISVLIILAIMLTRNVQQGNSGNRLRAPALIVAAVFLGVMAFAITYTPWRTAAVPPMSPTTLDLGQRLFSQNGFILPVEIAALILLSAVIGAIVIARDK